MLLRTSSAPLLNTPSFPPPHSDPHHIHAPSPSTIPSPPPPSSSSSTLLPSPPPPSSLLHRQASAEFPLLSSSSVLPPPSPHHRTSADSHAIFSSSSSSSSSSDRPFSPRPPILHRAQSEGDIVSTFTVSMNAGSQEYNQPEEHAVSSQNGSNLGFLSLGSGLSGTNNGGKGFYPRTTAEEGSRGFPDNRTDAYYQNILKKDPNNPLFLSNYAQFLAERGDLKGSEEYYERAILADPSDGEILSQYAKLQWTAYKDERRAEMYYDQAVQAAPDDCYVMASYASFLWDVEEDKEDSAAASAPMPLQGGGPGLLARA